MSKAFKKWLEKTYENYALSLVIKTIIPFLLPFIFDLPEEHFSNTAQWIMFGIFGFVELILIIILDHKNKVEKDEIYVNEMARKAYSNMYELNEKKRDSIVEFSYAFDGESPIDKKKIPYNIFKHIIEICGSFKSLICETTKISKEYLSVSFIYNYRFAGASTEDKSWRWVVGREQTMVTELNEFVKQNDTVYHALINGNVTSIFYNDKAEMAEQGLYHMSARDKRHNKIGSIFGVKLMFSNNAQSFAEGILIISSYGKRFVENNNSKEIARLKKLIIDDLFPSYQRLLEAELGTLYLSHEREENDCEKEVVEKCEFRKAECCMRKNDGKST